jgi:glycosyltransferase involved in cell wall biosynthesis
MENSPVNTPSKKILVFSPFYPPHIGGLESHSDEFNKYLSQEGVLISVFTPHLPENAPGEELRHGNVNILRFPSVELMHNYPIPKFWQSDFWKIWRSLSQSEYDIVISRTRFFFPSLMALWYAKKRGIPLLHIEHGSGFAPFKSEMKTTLGKIYDHTLGRSVLRSADFLVANSQASSDFVRKISGRTDCQVIYRGANREEIEGIEPNNALRNQYSGKTIIAFIGRLTDAKGVHDLIAAVAELNRNDIITLIIGGGPEENRLKKIVSDNHIEDQVIFFGNLPYREAISILKTTNIAVNPSYMEGLPTSVTEAALCGKAIIATNVGGTPEVISGINDGYLIEPRNIEQLKERLTDLIDHPEKSLLFGQNAYQEVRKKFDWNESSKKYLAVFSKLLDNRE